MSNIFDQLEQHSDIILRNSKTVLPTISRLLLVATFIEDGCRMWTQWDDQRDYIAYHWNLPMFCGVLFAIFNLFAQLIGSGMVITRKHVRAACGILLTVVFVQSIAYTVLWTTSFALKNLSLSGALALLLAETFESRDRNIYAGVPTLDNKKPQNYMQLVGRLLLISMFLDTLWEGFELSFFSVIRTAIACALMFLVTFGYKTKLSALLLAMYLFLINFYINPFWTFDYHSTRRDSYKYDFFQIWSVVGGLLMLINIGPGKVSLDHKRRAL